MRIELCLEGIKEEKIKRKAGCQDLQKHAVLQTRGRHLKFLKAMSYIMKLDKVSSIYNN